MSSEFIHNPAGIIVFDEPTTLDVSCRGASSTAQVTTLPFSLFNGDSVWAGLDTYDIPADAEFTVIENIEELSSAVEASEPDTDTRDLAELVDSDGN